MLQRDLAPLARGLQDRERDLDVGLAPAAVVQRRLAGADRRDSCRRALRCGRACRRRAAIAISRTPSRVIDQTPSAEARISPSRAGHDGDPEMRLVRRQAPAGRAIGEASRCAARASSAASRQRAARRAVRSSGFRRAALADAEMPLVGIEDSRSRCRPARPRRHPRIAGTRAQLPSVGRAGSSAVACARTLRTSPPPSSRTVSIWCGTWLNRMPPPCAVSSSSGRRGR